MSSGPGIFKRYLGEKKKNILFEIMPIISHRNYEYLKKKSHFQLKFSNEILAYMYIILLHLYHHLLIILHLHE